MDTLIVEKQAPFATITLNRPTVRNAMNFRMVDDLIAAFAELKHDNSIRAVVLMGAGGHFCSGGDIADLAESATMSAEAQDMVVARLDRMLRAVNTAPQVVVARLEGAVLGGGFGLACVSDIAIASSTASFGMPEVRLGLVPAVIAPFVIQRVGITRARQLMLTGERFNGERALDYGLVHEVTPPDTIETQVNVLLEELRQCSPNAIAACKGLIHESAGKSLDETVMYRARLLNSIRGGADGQEGMSAFLQKRPPLWALPESEIAD